MAIPYIASSTSADEKQAVASLSWTKSQSKIPKISVHLRLEMLSPLVSVQSPSHAIKVDNISACSADISLPESTMDRDFVVVATQVLLFVL